MKIIWSEKAEKKLDQIIKEAKSLPPHPGKGSMVPIYKRDDIREVFHNPYRIIYLLKDEIIEILSVIHGARLLPDDAK